MTVLRFLPIKEVTQLGKWNYLMLKNFASRAPKCAQFTKKTTLNERAERSEAPASLLKCANQTILYQTALKLPFKKLAARLSIIFSNFVDHHDKNPIFAV